jgi:adhesin HecA-like repeat protein
MASPLGTFIRERREALGLSQVDLAVRMGQPSYQSILSRLEQGQITLPRWERMGSLADALRVTPGTLLLRAGLVTAADLQLAAGTVGPSHPGKGQPRGEHHSPIGVIEDWETATVFTCA